MRRYAWGRGLEGAAQIPSETSRSDGGYRVSELADQGSFSPLSDGLASRDPLDYPGYREALDAAATKAGTDESVVAGPAAIGGRDVELAEFSFGFIGGSMGEVAGERIARCFERAAERGVPVVLHTRTGGARMQEGMRSLVQMPRVVAARLGLADAGQPFIAVLGSPTTGGVLASVGALADVTVAVSGATIGFAGPRVAASFTGRPLDPSSHTTTSAFRHGLVDEVIAEGDIHAYLAHVLATLSPDDPQPLDPPDAPGDGGDSLPWQVVEEVRRTDRPGAPSLLREAAEALIELRGDRAGGQDPALNAAIVRVAGRRAVALALDADHHPGPAAYRLARRAIVIAERLRLPVVTLVDTRGADPSEDSEAGGIAWEIASLFAAVLAAHTPVLSVVTGEGGSGGALAFASGDRLVAFDDTIFSVIGPEAAAEILWRDSSKAEKAASLLRLTAHDLLTFGIADALVGGPPEPDRLRRTLAYHLDGLAAEDVSAEERTLRRRARWRNGRAQE